MEDEKQILKSQIIWLTMELEKARLRNKEKFEFLQELVSPESLGHAVSNEVRQQAYTLLLQETNEPNQT